ncbi:MAG: hypothetical protein JNM17_25335 [Archangium sp.]|nr:hypothetical protein [Archangium sp.]
MFEDVLDAMGMTPREFAGVHVHFESVQRVDGPRFVVSVLFQAAFEPVPKTKLVVSQALSQRVLETRDVPSLEGGRVVRMRFQLKLDAQEEPVLAVRLDGEKPRGRRVRPAWKLHDVAEGTEPPMRGPLIEGTAKPLSEALFDLVWRPGQLVPQKPAPVLKPVAPIGPVRWCRWCGFEGPRAEYERARECPQCAEPWV